MDFDLGTLLSQVMLIDVINGISELMIKLFGEGLYAR